MLFIPESGVGYVLVRGAIGMLGWIGLIKFVVVKARLTADTGMRTTATPVCSSDEAGGGGKIGRRWRGVFENKGLRGRWVQAP